MLFLIFILFSYVLCCQTSSLKCDFETPCTDFIMSYDWILTDGSDPQPLDHDHTLNTISGHYIYYEPYAKPPDARIEAEIKTKTWLELAIDQSVCFRMWYYTPQLQLPISIQVAQGDDEKLIRILDTIPGKDPTINDWTLINIPLPAEKIKLYIRLNTSTVPLAFDDLSVDYCDGPRPLPSKTLYECDFESSCVDDFVSLSYYPYQWSIMKAEDAIKKHDRAPSVDFTFGNQSGHYAIVSNSRTTENGNAGYLALQKSFNITSNESFCLNFQYYSFSRRADNHLNVFLLLPNTSNIVQKLWPHTFPDYSAWSIVNLPVGFYSILFQVDSWYGESMSFSLDNISVKSCDYPPSIFTNETAYLSISCNFDDLTMCLIKNDDSYIQPTYNFTVHTGHTVPDRTLGPLRDHTNNSESGGFIFWNQNLLNISLPNGFVHSTKPIQSNLGMCIEFAYYVKSSNGSRSEIQLSILASGCYGSILWFTQLDDSDGWKLVKIPAPRVVCMITYRFSVVQQNVVPVSVAFDDIKIGQCNTHSSTTSTITTTHITGTQTITTTSNSSIMQSTTSLNNTRRLLSFSRYFMIIFYFLLRMI